MKAGRHAGAAALVAAALLGGAVAAAADPFALLGIERPRRAVAAPALALTRLDGRPLAPAPDGRPLVVHFWATWCGPCREELPALAALARDTGGEARVLAIALDRDPEPVRRLLAHLGERVAGLTVLLDPGGASRGRWQVTVLPVTYLVDARGRVAGRAVGARDWDSPAARALLRGLAGPAAR